MLIRRRCAYAKADGQPCQMAPLRDRPYCFAHDPERAEEAADARRLGGLRRRKEGTIAVAYDLPGLDTVVGIRRLLDIVVTDGVGLDNGIPRLRVLISTAVAAMNLLKVGELEERLAALEGVVGHRTAQAGDDPFGLPLALSAVLPGSRHRSHPPSSSCAGSTRRMPSAISSPTSAPSWPSRPRKVRSIGWLARRQREPGQACAASVPRSLTQRSEAPCGRRSFASISSCGSS